MVYQALDTRLNTLRAIKVLRADEMMDATARQRFLREARLIAALEHPHIVAAHDVFEEQGRLHLVMELAPTNLAAWVRRRGAEVDCVTGRPRLEGLGVEVPRPVPDEPEHRLYDLLAAKAPDDAHSQYNALIRRLVSFEHALEARAAVGPPAP